MRIAFVAPEYITESSYDGGLANYLGRVCPMLAERGHEVVVFVRSDCDGRLSQDGVEIRRVIVNPRLIDWARQTTWHDLRAAVQWLGQSWALNRACLEVHRKCPFDLVQYASYTGTGFFRLGGVSSVVRISSYEPALQQAYGYPDTRENRSRIWMERRAICRADAVFGPSRLIAGMVERDVGRPVAVIESPFTLNTDGLDETVCRERLAGKKYLLFFGSLSKLKGVHLIAEIIGKLLDAYPELSFVFAGKCFSYLGKPIIDHVREGAGPARDRVIYLGPLRHHQLYPVVANAHAVVLPSLMDNFPNACIEAMAFRRVVIASRGASFEQLIDHGISGLLCDNESPQDLYREIVTALSLSDERREIMGETAAKRIEYLHPDRIVKKLIEFYREVSTKNG